ncbi:MAG: DUF2953 domain-containing protein [Hyphomicrobiales bacterium]
MNTLAFGVLWAMLGAVVLCLVVLALPVRVAVRAQTTPKKKALVELGLLGGVLPSFTIVDSSRKDASKDKQKADKRARKRAKKRDPKSGGSWRSVQVWIGGVPALLGDLLNLFHVEHLHAEADFGFDDPCDTGVVFGLLTPVLYGLPSNGVIGVQARPDFSQARLEGRFDATVRLIPLQLVAPIVRYLKSVVIGLYR